MTGTTLTQTDFWWPYGSSVGRYTFKATGGSLSQLHVTDNRGAGTPLHIHHDADETFYVLEGEVTIVVGDERVEARAGDFVSGPRGVPHAFTVTSESAEMLVTFGPAGGFHEFVSEVAVPASEPKPEPRMPDMPDFVARMNRHNIELVGPAA